MTVDLTTGAFLALLALTPALMVWWRERHLRKVAELKLKTTHPGTDSVTPCSRCAAPIDRTLPHVSYNYLEGEMTDWTITNITDSTELAVLCRDCEEPDAPVTQTAAAAVDQPERSRA